VYTICSFDSALIPSGLSAITAMLALILFFACEGKPYFSVPSIVLAKFYSNSLMVLFNTRMRIIDGRDSGNLPLTMRASLSSMHIGSNNTRHSVASRLGNIHVREDVWIEADEETTIGEASII
jgi:hypothetical protein